jgi:phospholipid/cholesterol/gamma-HCH transport system substrate-binding protein
MMSRTTGYVLAGAGVWLAIGLIAFYAFTSGGLAQRGGYAVVATFDQVDGLSLGAPVYLAGVKIGEVTRMRLDAKSYRPTVTLGIREGVRLPEDSGALIMSDGILGGKFVRIEPGSETAHMKPGDAFQIVQDSVIVEQLLERIVVTAEARRKAAAAPDGKDPGNDAPAPAPDRKAP